MLSSPESIMYNTLVQCIASGRGITLNRYLSAVISSVRPRRPRVLPRLVNWTVLDSLPGHNYQKQWKKLIGPG
jgi:hypothetical protein